MHLYSSPQLWRESPCYSLVLPIWLPASQMPRTIEKDIDLWPIDNRKEHKSGIIHEG
jgi:hypothetical protein